MTVTKHAASAVVERPAPSSFEDALALTLDKGVVIDVASQVSLVGVEILFIDGRVVVGSIDTYLRLANQLEGLLLDGDTKAPWNGSVLHRTGPA